MVNGARLEYLDWGGEGPVLLLLPGVGNSAHIFDDLAPKLTPTFHVLGLSRRAHGRSEITAAGYGVDTLVADIQAFTSAKKFDNFVLMGHSFGGMEMTRFAQLHPGQVKALIYLDAAYDYRNISNLWSQDPVNINPSAAELKNIAAGRDWFQKHFGFWSEALETDTRIVNEQENGRLRLESMPPPIMGKLMTQLSNFKPDYRSFTFPVLAFYAQTQEHPFINSAPDSVKLKANEYWQTVFRPDQEKSIALLQAQKPDAIVVRMPETKHLCYIRDQDQQVILEQIKNLKIN